LTVANNNLPDGNVVVTIRPEAITIGANGANNVAGVVRSYGYHGSIARCCADVNGIQLQIAAPPFAKIDTDTPILLYLPPERICLLSPESCLPEGNEGIGTCASDC